MLSCHVSECNLITFSLMKWERNFCLTFLLSLTILGSIPVVIKRDVRGTTGTYWSNVKWIINGNQHFSFSIGESFPALGFPYSELLVEVDGHIVESRQLMDYLETIPMSVLEKKLHKISTVRNRFVYDFEGTVPDAFSTMIEAIETYLKDL